MRSGTKSVTPLATTLLAVSLAAVAAVAGCGSPVEVGPPIIDGVAFVGMTVSDIDRSSVILRESADLQSMQLDPAEADNWRLGVGGSDPEVALMRGVNSQLLLMEYPGNADAASPVDVQGPGIAHVCYQVDQETQTYEAFLEHGATPIGAQELVQINPKRPVYYGYIHDPDGIMFEIEHVDIAALDLPVPPPNAYRIRHVSISTPDMDRAVGFYSQLFSEPEPRRVGKLISLSGDKLEKVSGLEGAKIEMAWFQSRNLELELIQYKSHKTERPEVARPMLALGFNMIVFDTTDLAAARERVVNAGGEIVTDRDLSDGRFYARDLDGNLLAFQKAGSGDALSSKHFDGNGT